MAETPTDAFVVRPELQGFLPELDGLRALAIAGVFVTHAFQWLRTPATQGLQGYGRVGVDLFFVISGFLITGILLESRSRPHALRDFYARRALRIWPIYYALLVFTFYLGPWLHPEFRFSHDRFPFWPFALYLQNLLYLFFVPASLWYTWSLCIEEQFYLVWPVVVRRLRPQWLFGACVLVLFASCLLRMELLGVGIRPVALYVFTLTRLDALMAGAGLAVWMRRPAFSWKVMERWNAGVTVAGLGLGALIMVWSRLRWPENEYLGYDLAFFPLALGFAGLLGAALLSRQKQGWLSSALSLRPLRYVGKISYGIYIVHPGVIFFFLNSHLADRIRSWPMPWLSDLVVLSLEAVLVLGVATISWFVFERPILRLKRFFAAAARGPRLAEAVSNP